MTTQAQSRARRKRRIRKKISGTTDRPRLSVFRSARHVYAQVIDDTTGRTLATASSQTKGLETPEGEATGKVAAARAVGATIAKVCTEKGITQVVFDRNGFMYHGRVRALADAAREAGLSF